MKHARSDYDPIQDPRPDGIPEDEPVFLLRAQDALAPDLISVWISWYSNAGGDQEVIEGLRNHVEDMINWQDKHGDKLADVPEGAMR